VNPTTQAALLGALVFAATWWIAYEALKPTIASAAGAYVTANALANVPAAVQPLVDALGAQDYATLLGQAVQSALASQLP
jgi:hypothetical protein